MASAKQEQDEFLSYLDGMMACIEQYPMFNLEVPIDNVGAATNAMTLLMLILSKFCTVDELIEWLAKFLTYTLPVMELGVKGVLLSNFKEAISCNIDPWIPEEWRQHFDSINRKRYDTSEFNPLTYIPIPKIDYRGLLQISPLSKEGQQYYAKTKVEYTHMNPSATITKRASSNYNELYAWVQEMHSDKMIGDLYSEKYIKNTGDLTSMYELARAYDMNAFLWFVANKGIYADVQFENINQKDTDRIDKVNIATESKRIETTTVESREVNQHAVYLSGDIVSTEYKENGEDSGHQSTNFLMCYDGQRAFTEESLTYHSHLIPCSNEANSFNWYVNRKNYGKIIFDGINKKNQLKRNYDDEFALCNIACTDASGNPATNSLSNYIRVRALPKPMLHYPKFFWLIEKNQASTVIPFTKILFDSKGNPDKKGKFTVCPLMNGSKIAKPEYKKFNVGGTEKELALYDLAYPKTNIRNGFYLAVDDKNKTYFTGTKPGTTGGREKFINDSLVACYPGLTIYEFNYDFVMGMKLFDPKCVATRIIQTLTCFRLGYDVSLSMTETIYQMRIAEIVKNLIEADDYEVSDCFFSFSNEKYQEMLDEAEKKKQHGYTFRNDNHMVSIDGENIMEILNEYSSESSLNEQKDVFKRTFEQATANITEEVLPEDKLNVGKNFIMESIKILATTIFETLISPKMLLLFEVNKRLMGEFTTEFPSLETILQELANLLTGIISEIMQIILKELMDFVMEKISGLIVTLASMLTLEQLNFYKELIERLIKACTFKFPLYGKRALLDTKLDVVQYADIDDVEKPKTNEC